MPINPRLKALYPSNWPEISQFVRFDREKGICQSCGRNHGMMIRQLPDGRWYDDRTNIWRDKGGMATFPPDMFEFSYGKTFKVYLAAAHIDHDPRINGDHNYDRLAAWCQRCHLNHDRPFHIKARRFMRKSRYAVGDLFLGDYSNFELLFIM
jgi:hypothetical protein